MSSTPEKPDENKLDLNKITLSVKELMELVQGGHSVGVNPIKIKGQIQPTKKKE